MEAVKDLTIPGRTQADVNSKTIAMIKKLKVVHNAKSRTGNGNTPGQAKGKRINNAN